MHSVLRVDPSIWGVKLRNTSQEEEPLSEPAQDPVCCDPGQGDRLLAFQSRPPLLGPPTDPLAAEVIPGGGPLGLLGALHGSAGGGASDQDDFGAILAELYGVEVEGVELEAEEGLKDHVDDDKPRVEKPESADPALAPEADGGGEDLAELPLFDALLA